jgi:transcriptional regulator with XRE-family HTH domain
MRAMTENRGTTALGDYLVRALEGRGWNAAMLARDSNISESNLGRWIKGTTLPSIDNARLLADALDVPLVEVLVVAGLLTPDEVGASVVTPDITALPDDALVAELGRRLKRAPSAPTADQVAADPGRYEVIGKPDASTRKARK